MAAVLPVCPREYMAGGNVVDGLAAQYDPPCQPILRRAITDPARGLRVGEPTVAAPLRLHSLEPMSVCCTTDVFQTGIVATPPSVDGETPWTISQKNTFLSVEAPEQQPLLRSSTAPTDCSTGSADADTDQPAKLDLDELMRPAPPPLTLEFFATEDNFGPNSTAAAVEDAMPSPPGLPIPPPLELEFIETDDPFRRTPAAAERLGLLTPPPLSLEFVATEDAFGATPRAPPALPLLSTFDYAATDDPFHTTSPTGIATGFLLEQAFQSVGYLSADPPAAPLSDFEWPPGLPPPPLPLESFDTEDPFENPHELVPMAAPELACQPQSMPAICGPPPPPMAPAPLLGTPAPMPPPPPPAQMPLMPAPKLEEPSSLDAPMAQPGHTPGASLTALLSTELRQPGLLARQSSSGCTHVHWAVDSRKLDGQDKQAVSQVFKVDLPDIGPTPFKLVLYPKATNDGKHGASFKKSKKQGRIVLKCEAQMPESLSDVSFRVGIGRAGKGSGTLQPFRGPAMENFFEHSCHGLPKTDENWDFSSSIEDSRIFMVTVEIAPTAMLAANPGIWWAPLATSADGDVSVTI